MNDRKTMLEVIVLISVATTLSIAPMLVQLQSSNAFPVHSTIDIIGTG